MKHRVKTHHWLNGKLYTKEKFFLNFEQALGYANEVDSHHIKIYDENDNLVHDSKPETETYA